MDGFKLKDWIVVWLLATSSIIAVSMMLREMLALLLK